MGTIFSGVGLVSGIDIQALVDGLIAVSSRPRDMLRQRVGTIDAQRAAFADISARISAVLSHVNRLKEVSTFNAVKAGSSNTSVLTASVGAGARPGAYSFTVRSLATAQQVVSRGFASADAALPAGVVTIESARARVNNQTRLEELNGMAGVQRGAFKLTDGTGASATINLADAVTVNDVLEKINAAGIRVRAELRDDHIVLEETEGGALRVSEVDGGRAAADLGFGPGHTYSAGGRIEGSDVMYVAGGTLLARLNDGNGIRRAEAGGDFTISGDGFEAFKVDLSGILTFDTRIAQLNHGNPIDLGTMRITTTDAAGTEQQHVIDLAGLETVGQLRDAIQAGAPGVSVTLAGNPGRLVIAYADNTSRPLKIEDVTGNAAQNLGIASSSSLGKIDGRQIYFMDTVQDVLNAINHATGNAGHVTASIDGTGLKLTSNSGGALTLAQVGSSRALGDLGLAAGTISGVANGARIIGGIDTVLMRSLNGGQGFETGQIRIQHGAGDITVDLGGVQTLGQAVQRINDAAQAAGMAIEAGYDATGVRLELRSIDGVTPLTVSDVQGEFAAQLGITGGGAVLRSDNLQRQYISENTRLSSLNGGAGATPGKLKITNAMGISRSIDLSTSQARTIGDVINRINALSSELNVQARINDTGDGVLIEDLTGGAGPLTVVDESGSIARDLRLAGEHADGRIDGSFEERYEVGSGMTLAGLVAKINASGRLATASVLNDGSELNPHRLHLTSKATGLAGELVIDGGALGLDLTTMSRAQDARVLVGGEGGVLMTSSSNTLTNVAPGLTINLTGTSDEPVEVNVTPSLESVIEAMNGLINGLNSALGRISELGRYNAETGQRGILLGDGSLRSVETRLLRMMNRRVEGTLNLLGQVGVRIESGQLTFDEQKFRDAMAENPAAVAELFTDTVEGFGPWLEEQLKAITDQGGLLDRRNEVLNRQRTLLSSRVEQMNELLERRRARLTRQFLAMESALAELQSQQTALTQLAALASNAGAMRGGSR